MRILYLCRHAKSSWSDPQQVDFDRPLNDRGRRNAPFMAGTFRDRGEAVDLLVSSPAARAIATARAFAEALGAKEREQFDPTANKPQLVKEPALYPGSMKEILRTVNALPADAQSVMLFGHNPGFSDAVVYFSSVDIGNLPTCGIVRIDFPFNDWNEVSADLGNLIWQDRPKHHSGQS